MTARLRQSGVPIRLIWGSDDAYFPPATAGQRLADALGVELTVVPGGHFLPLDNPDGVAGALLEACA